MIQKTREQSVMLNINDLWKGIEELQRAVIKLHEKLEEGTPTDQTDVEARLETIEKVLWGEGK